jgi:hypothetical protein
VISLSSLLVNQDSEKFGEVMSIVTTYLLAALTFVTSPGRPLGLKSTPLSPSADIMFIQNTTSVASIVSPLDHFQPGLSLIVTWCPR